MLNLLALLTNSIRPLTFEEIMKRMSSQYPEAHEAKRTAFERDKKILRELGVPFTTKTLGGNDAGKTAYAIDKSGYGLVDFGLTTEELSALQEAAALVQTGTSWGKQAVLWLGGDVVSSDAPTASNIPADGDVLPTLWQAIASSQAISFTYHGTSRHVHPYGLVSRNGFWYLVGKDNARDKQIVFRVDRFDSDVLVHRSETFERPGDFDITKAFARDPKDFVQSAERALVRIDGGVAPAVLHELGAEAVITQHDDGSVDVEVPCANEVAFRTWLFAMVDRAEVLSPAHVREQVVSWLREMAEVR
jgi:predicted DNA-binding transcriptional regulator YafY